MTRLVWRKKRYFSTTSTLCDRYSGFHHCTGSQQSASRGLVLAFYRIAPCLSAVDLQEAKLALSKQAQIESFQDDYKDLQTNRSLAPKSSLLPLQPVLIDGVIRVGSRLERAPIPFEAKHQVLLSPKHPLSRLVVQDIHERHFHVGREHTLYANSSGFWEESRLLERSPMNAFTARGEGLNQPYH